MTLCDMPPRIIEICCRCDGRGVVLLYYSAGTTLPPKRETCDLCLGRGWTKKATTWKEPKAVDLLSD